MKRSIWNLLFFAPICAVAQFAGNDDFNDNSLDISLWERLTTDGAGQFLETDQRLEYDSGGQGLNRQYLKWADASYDQDFDLVVRAGNIMNANDSNESSAVGIEVYLPGTFVRLNLRLATYYFFGFGGSRDVLANFYIGDSTLIPSSPAQPLVFPESAMLRLSFDSTSKIFTAYYDGNPTDGTQWTQLATFGVGASAGGDYNYNFGMSSGSFFGIYLYAFTDEMGADPGEMILDDFQAVLSPATEPEAQVAESVTVDFETELGRAYQVKRSTDLSASSAFAAVDVVASDGLYRIVPQGEGDPLLTGTGTTLSLIDEIEGNDKAFYQIQAQ